MIPPVPVQGAAATAAVLLAVLLSGCAAEPGLQAPTSSARYWSGDAVTEIPEPDRGDPVEFSGILDSGQPASSVDWAGQVVVVNFWYAACGPCRAEAPDLQALATRFAIGSEGGDDTVAFVGVNVRDQPATAISFDETFGIGYPSIMDAETGAVQLAFAGQIAPNAVPSTVVLDREGRVAARIIGQLDRSVLETLITGTVGESR